jgi:SAM-dependent methyltransferase
MKPPDLEGYITDTIYKRTFTRELAPAWLDHVAIIAGFAPPDRGDAFTWCDLGCGHGATAVLLAATHPKGRFHGLDAMAEHVESARGFADACALRNTTFHNATFDEAIEREFPLFDYIVSHGVYSWVDEEVRRSWRKLVDRHLKPGGLVYVSYNALPGRAADLPFQQLVRTLGMSLTGNSAERVRDGLALIRPLADLKARALASSPMASAFLKEPERYPLSYLAHELMNGRWEPLSVSDVRAEMAEIGLEPAGSARLIENYDSFVLGGRAREALAAIADPNAREFARDFFLNQSFRHDVFVRDGRRIGNDERRRRLIDSAFLLARRVESVEYSAKTPAGDLKFDNRTARAIVSGLIEGPRRLGEIDGSAAEKDLIANMAVLSAADVIWPVNADAVDVSRVNAAIAALGGGDDGVGYSLLPCGTAVRTRPEVAREGAQS